MPIASTKLLTHLATESRQMFEVLLKRALGHTQSNNTCLHASILVMATLTQFAKVQALVRGGGGSEMDGGLLGPDRTWHGHYWTEVKCSETGRQWVVDITADQFGGPPVVVLPLDQAVNYLPSEDQAEIDAHVREELERMRVEGTNPGR